MTTACQLCLAREESHGMGLHAGPYRLRRLEEMERFLSAKRRGRGKEVCRSEDEGKKEPTVDDARSSMRDRSMSINIERSSCRGLFLPTLAKTKGQDRMCLVEQR